MKLDELTRKIAEEFDIDLSQQEFEGAMRAVRLKYGTEHELFENPGMEHQWNIRKYTSTGLKEDIERYKGYVKMRRLLYTNAVDVSSRAAQD